MICNSNQEGTNYWSLNLKEVPFMSAPENATGGFSFILM